jgi:hypothetical protein
MNCDFTKDLLAFEGSWGTVRLYFCWRYNVIPEPLDRRTVGLDVFTRLDGLGEAYDHRTGVTLIRDIGEVLYYLVTLKITKSE